MRVIAPSTGCGRLSAVMLFLLAGCGGGGGGGGGTTALVYSGNTNHAAVTGTNASKLTADALGSGETAALISGTSIQGDGYTSGAGGGASDVARRLNWAFRYTLARGPSGRQSVAPGVTFDDTEPCDGGNGTIRTAGTIGDDGTGTFTITFTNCLLGTDTLNGTATATVAMADLFFRVPTDFTVNAPRLAIRGPGISNDAGGTLRIQSNLGTNTETITSNLVTLDNLTGAMTRTENLVLVNVYDNIHNPMAIFNGTITGRIFDSVHGFVDVITITPFQFASTNQVFPNVGVLRLVGNASGAFVTALSFSRVQIQPDANNDGTPDGFAALLNWTDLSAPVAADLRDTDMDGMHNSWETVNNAANALDDPDGDGSDNLAEYNAGSNPNNINSTPANP
jgi:hypothetical protein